MSAASSRALRVLEPGPLTTVQDDGRPGYASWGVTRSGACDRGSYRLANRLVGNVDGAAALEVTLGGLAVAAVDGPLTLAVTGAPCPGAPLHAPFVLAPGQVLRLRTPPRGLRSYVAVRGGVAVDAVLGSRSHDTLSGLGPPPVRAGDVLRVGQQVGPMPGVDHAPVPHPGDGVVVVRVTPGPRLGMLAPSAWSALLSVARPVGTDSDRVGLRLGGPVLPRDPGRAGEELPSEGVLRGAVQVPPSGTPVVFLADHPVTGGYPVVAYVHDDALRSDVDLLAQVRPGQPVRFVDGSSR